jgi:hypothetical protein
MERNEQGSLFEIDPWWKKHWCGMPEFKQRDLTPVKQLTVNFEKQEDIEAFAELVGQTITPDTRSIWYPEADINHYVNKRFSAEGSK